MLATAQEVAYSMPIVEVAYSMPIVWLTTPRMARARV
jgi:hypothetical protein